MCRVLGRKGGIVADDMFVLQAPERLRLDLDLDRVGLATPTKFRPLQGEPATARHMLHE